MRRCSRQHTDVRVYAGLGTDRTSLQMLLRSLRAACSDQYEVTTISPKEILSGIWQQTTALLAIGGGFDTGYRQALSTEGITQIRSYVLAGGNYLGICAGAYFGCTKVVFDRSGPLEVIGVDRLSFFPGECVGPAVAGFKYSDQSGACAMPATWWLGDESEPRHDQTSHQQSGSSTRRVRGSSDAQFCRPEARCADSTVECRNHLQRPEEWPRTVTCYLNGGGCFNVDGTNQPDTVEVLARFTELDGTPVAAVKCRPGKGLAVLSALHVEYIAEQMNTSDVHLEKILPALLADSNQRLLCFRQILMHLDISLS